MFRRRAELEEDTPRRRRPDRSWSTRIAWLTLFGGAALLVTRLSIATVVEIHGDGMAPTLVDGDHVVIVRDRWDVERGDIVVYDPAAATPGDWEPPLPPEGDDPEGEAGEGEEYPDARREPGSDLRNTAVVDRDELGDNWEKVKKKSDGLAARERVPLRLGRVPRRARRCRHLQRGSRRRPRPRRRRPAPCPKKRASRSASRCAATSRRPRRPPRPCAPSPTSPPTSAATPSSSAATEAPPGWEGLSLPDAASGPVELEAPGYLVVADNRDDGACCDSRRLGWIPEAALKGKVLMRLAGDPKATPDLDPSARGFLWAP